MLALMRKAGQAIRVGHDLWVTVLEICGSRAKIRFMTQLAIRPTRGTLQARLENGGQTVTCYGGEIFRIGDDIIVSVARVERGRVVFGIEADHSVPIDREEVYLRKQQERLNGRA